MTMEGVSEELTLSKRVIANKAGHIGVRPIIKWAGGKRQLLPAIKRLMPSSYGRYFEPFLGGGAVLFSVQPDVAVVNDLNPQLINLYRQVKQAPNELLEAIWRLDDVHSDKEYYLKNREKYNDKIVSSTLDAECAALMVWLNKHCFNGLYRTNRKGLFNVPYNNRKSGISVDGQNLRAMSIYLNSHEVGLLCGDFEKACEGASVDDLVYFDSPYLPMSETANFTNYTGDGFGVDEHKRLARLFKRLDKKGVKLMLSNNDTPLAYELYGEFNIHTVAVSRAINRNGSARTSREIIVTNY